MSEIAHTAFKPQALYGEGILPYKTQSLVFTIILGRPNTHLEPKMLFLPEMKPKQFESEDLLISAINTRITHLVPTKVFIAYNIAQYSLVLFFLLTLHNDLTCNIYLGANEVSPTYHLALTNHAQ